MATVSHVVKRTINTRPMLQQAMIEGIVNFSALAENLKPGIETELGLEVKKSAVMMALRRLAEQLEKRTGVEKKLDISPEVIMKTNLCDVCMVKSPSALDKIKAIYQVVDFEKGETLNVIQGNYEITVVMSQKYLARMEDILKGEKILNIERELVSLTLTMSRDFLSTPGVLALATRKLAWDNVNIFENISTMTELIFIIAKDDAIKAYNTFQQLIEDLSKDDGA